MRFAFLLPAIVLLIAACNGDSTPAPDTPVPTTATPTTSPPTPVTDAPPTLGPDVVILDAISYISAGAARPDPAALAPAGITETGLEAFRERGAGPAGVIYTREPAGGYRRWLPEVVRLAIKDLAGRLGIQESDIAVASVTGVDWPDACLGVEVSGQVCAQVITPGFRIILETGGRQHEYHSDTARVVIPAF